jgi:glucosamine--fructose-6-phosphate aminotransferase (isomerizing)
LIDAQTPTIVVLPRDELYAKNISTIEEIRARRGPIYVVTHSGSLPVEVDGVLEVPRSEPELDAILLTIPLQLLAYRVALARGTDIDQPRNLAKSVTVE